MDEKKLERLMDDIGELTPAQFKALVLAYADKSSQRKERVWQSSVYTVTEQHLATLGVNDACPYCGSTLICRDGFNDSGLQRFKCLDCEREGRPNKHFTRLTNTILHKSKLPWEVWVKTLEMLLADRSLEDTASLLEQDYGCDGINIKTVHRMRLILVYAMADVPPPTLSGVIQMDESFVRESQKGSRALVSYVKGLERRPRYGRHPSKYGTMGAEFATILTAIDSRELCVCKVVSLGRAPTDAAIEMIEQYCIDPSFICTDANTIYQEACDLLSIPHYVRPSNYNKVTGDAGYVQLKGVKLPPDEYARHLRRNRDLMERLYREGEIDYIEHREDLTYPDFKRIKQRHHLSLGRVNQLHDEIKYTIERQMTNVSTHYLNAYMGFITFRHNWRWQNGHRPANLTDAESILEYLVARGMPSVTPEQDKEHLNLPKPSGRAMQLLKDRTEQARQLAANKYFKFDAEDVPNFNRREILLDAPRVRLNEIARAYGIKGYTKMTQWGLAYAITKLPDLDQIIMDLVLTDRHYMIADEDLEYIKAMRYARKSDSDDSGT